MPFFYDAATSLQDPALELASRINLATSYAIRVVVSLGVAEQLAAGVREVDAIAGAVDADPDTLTRLLRYLVHREVFTEEPKGHFGLTDVSRLLLDRSPGGMGRWLDLDVEAHRRFIDELMLVRSEMTSPQVAELDDWNAVTDVVDVGGGSGGLLAELLGKHWSDPEATRILDRMADAAGDKGRVQVIELPTDPQEPYSTSFDLEMLVTVGGRERTLDDFNAIAAAGLAPTQVIRGQQALVLLEYACASC